MAVGRTVMHLARASPRSGGTGLSPLCASTRIVDTLHAVLDTVENFKVYEANLYSQQQNKPRA